MRLDNRSKIKNILAFSPNTGEGHEIRSPHDSNLKWYFIDLRGIIRVEKPAEGIKDERSPGFVLLFVPKLVSQPRRYRRHIASVAGESKCTR